MSGTSLAGLDRKRLRRWLVVFFLALAIPTGTLVTQAYSQLKWEAFHQHRVLAEELAARIDAQLVQLINTEEARSFADYAFLNVAGDPSANFLQRSPLSAYPLASPIPGLVGYFQVDTDGLFTTPLVPSAGTPASRYGISAGELERRLARQQQIGQILSRNRLVQVSKPAQVSHGEANEVVPQPNEVRRDRQAGLATDKDALAPSALDDRAVPAAENMAEEVPGQAAFDRLNRPDTPREQETKQQAARTLGRIEDLKLDYRYQTEAADAVGRPAASGAPEVTKRARKERSVLPEPAYEAGAAALSELRETDAPAPSQPESAMRVRTFESEIDPFEFSLLDSGHFVLFRKVWRDGQRYI